MPLVLGIIRLKFKMHFYTGKGASSTFTEAELLRRMKINEMSEENYKVLVDRLKKVVFKTGYYG